MPDNENENNYVTMDQFGQLRDTVAGLSGNLGQVRTQVTQGFENLTNLMQRQPQPQTQATPVQTQAPTQQVQQAPQASDANSELSRQITHLLQEVIPTLENRVRTSERMMRLNAVAPELASNQAILAMVQSSTLDDDQLFESIEQLRPMFAQPAPVEEPADANAPAASATDNVSAAAENTSDQASTSRSDDGNDDIPDGVPPVNRPFANNNAGETVGEQLDDLIASGNVQAVAAKIEEQMQAGTLQVGRTLGQQRAARGGQS